MDVTVVTILVTIGLANLGAGCTAVWLLANHDVRIKNLEKIIN